MEYEREIIDCIKQTKSLERSFLKGLLFLVRFFKKQHCFKHERIEYIRCLLTLVCTYRKEKYKKLFKGILLAELERAIKIPSDFFDSCFLLYACKYSKRLFEKLHKKMKRFTRKTLPNNAKRLLKENDFDSLSDEAIDHLYVKLCRKRVKLPKDHFCDYWKALKRDQDYRRIIRDGLSYDACSLYL